MARGAAARVGCTALALAGALGVGRALAAKPPPKAVVDAGADREVIQDLELLQDLDMLKDLEVLTPVPDAGAKKVDEKLKDPDGEP